VVYIQDLRSNVYAISLATGALLWKFSVNAPTLGPNGVAVEGGRVFADSPDSVFALNATTGKVLWFRDLVGARSRYLSIQPQVSDGRVYLATAAGPLPGGGTLFALSASTGALLWQFATVPKADPGVKLAGGAWETPLVGPDGTVTYGIGNPYQSIGWGVSNPSQLLYTDSDVNLSAATGQLRWYFQALPDDFYDYDMQVSPISTVVDGVPAVIGAGKMGFVYAIDGRSGRLLWKATVGEHDGHDDDSTLALQHESSLAAPYAVAPGAFGGVLANMALDDGTLYVGVCDFPYEVSSLNEIFGQGSDVKPVSDVPTGEVEALDVNTGVVKWVRKVPQLPLGAITVSNDLVLTSLYQGELVALNRFTGAIVTTRKLPTSTNAPIAIAGRTIIVPAGGPIVGVSGHHPQVDAYAVS
jgi:outer membrane protein assembly factor BamB